MGALNKMNETNGHANGHPHGSEPVRAAPTPRTTPRRAKRAPVDGEATLRRRLEECESRLRAILGQN